MFKQNDLIIDSITEDEEAPVTYGSVNDPEQIFSTCHACAGNNGLHERNCAYNRELWDDEAELTVKST